MARKSKKNGSDSANGVVEVDMTPPVEIDDVSELTEDERPEAPEPAEPDEPMDAAGDEADPPAEVPMPGPIDRPAKPTEPEPDPFWAKLVDRQREADEIHAEYLGLAEDAKQKKKQWEAKQEEVASLIRGSINKPMPLFDRKPKSEPFEADDAAERDGEEREVMSTEPVLLKIAGVSDAAAEAIAAEDFQSIPIWALVDFGMPKKYVGILVDGGVETIGDVKRLGDKGLDVTSVKGVGESARDKINAAMDEMWRARGEQQAHAASAQDAESPAADWVDPDVAEDPEDWGPADDAPEPEADDDQGEGDGYQSDPDYDDPSDPTYDQDDEFEQEGCDALDESEQYGEVHPDGPND